jgi:hypothetical protein
MFEKRVLRRTFGSKQETATGDGSGLDSSGSEQVPFLGSYKYGNERLVSIKAE